MPAGWKPAQEAEYKTSKETSSGRGAPTDANDIFEVVLASALGAREDAQSLLTHVSSRNGDREEQPVQCLLQLRGPQTLLLSHRKNLP